MSQTHLYFDFNATTFVDSRVIDKLPEWLSFWGNPSSIHHHGRGPKKLLREARRQLARLMEIHPLEIVFTSGGSESNNLALKGCLLELKRKGSQRRKVILGGIEHPSILQQKSQLEEMGFVVELIPVNANGEYDLIRYQELLDEDVALVSVMLANNEVGVIAPIKKMCRKAHQMGALFHSDMVQVLGKYPFSLKHLNVDMASFSSHKIYALKGAGMLYVKKGTPFEGLTVGGSQERKRRAGTENLVSISSFAYMAELLDGNDFNSRLSVLRDRFEETIQNSISGVTILGGSVTRLANTSCFTVDGVSGEMMLMNLDIRGFSVGTGAACSSGNPEPSPVLLAMGLTHDQAQSSLRISLGKDSTQKQVDQLAQALKEVVEHLRQLSSKEEVAHV